MPSHQTSPSSVSATLVKITLALQHLHRVRIRFVRGARRDAEIARLRIDRVEPPVVVRLDPRDVVADGRDLPALESLRRNQHREIGLAARARKCRRDVALLARRRRDAEDQHVLGEPALVAAHHRRDAQREAFLAEQRVAAVARAVRPDLARLREVDDVLVVLVARPRDVRLPGARAARRPNARTARTAPSAPSTSYTRAAHARHQLHVDDDVRAVGELDADVRDVTADRSHRERHDVHRAPAHASVEEPLSVPRISAGATQLLVGPASSSFSLQMNVRSSTRATSDGSDSAR